MAYTVTQTLTDAFYLSGVVDNELETVSGSQLTQGLQWLNSVLSIQTSNPKLIPFFTKYEFNAVVGQEEYPIPNLVSVETFVFYLNSVRFSMTPLDAREYFGSPRVENVNSLPNVWAMRRTPAGASLFVYFEPDQAYPMEIWGKFSIDSVTLNQDLRALLPQWYIDYLAYETANRIGQYYGKELADNIMTELFSYRMKVSKISPIDLTVSKVSTLQRNPGFNWASFNIAPGYGVPR